MLLARTDYDINMRMLNVHNVSQEKPWGELEGPEVSWFVITVIITRFWQRPLLYTVKPRPLSEWETVFKHISAYYCCCRHSFNVTRMQETWSLSLTFFRVGPPELLLGIWQFKCTKNRWLPSWRKISDCSVSFRDYHTWIIWVCSAGWMHTKSASIG